MVLAQGQLNVAGGDPATKVLVEQSQVFKISFYDFFSLKWLI
jgi:hypothetical protein